MVARIRVDDVKSLNGVEMVLHRPCGIDIRHAGIEPASEQRHEPFLFEAVLIRPLPFVFKMRLVKRFIVRGVDIVHTGFEAGVHDMQILIGKRKVQHHVGPDFFNQFDQMRHIVRIHLSRGNRAVVFFFDLSRKRIALGLCAACDAQLGENFADLAAFGNGDTGYAAAADNKNFAHDDAPFIFLV